MYTRSTHPLVLEPGTPVFAPAPPPPPPPLTDDAQSLSASLSFSYSHTSHDSASHSTADADHRDQQRRHPVPPDRDRYQRVLRLVNEAHPLGWRVDARHTDRDRANDGDGHNSFVLRAPPPHRAARNTQRMQRIVERSNERQPRLPPSTLQASTQPALRLPRPPLGVGHAAAAAPETTRRP